MQPCSQFLQCQESLRKPQTPLLPGACHEPALWKADKPHLSLDQGEGSQHSAVLAKLGVASASVSGRRGRCWCGSCKVMPTPCTYRSECLAGIGCKSKASK